MLKCVCGHYVLLDYLRSTREVLPWTVPFGLPFATLRFLRGLGCLDTVVCTIQARELRRIVPFTSERFYSHKNKTKAQSQKFLAEDTKRL